LCVDRTFLLISWDPSCVNAGNMPFPLVVRSLDRGAANKMKSMSQTRLNELQRN
jgi:hypothetical protein